MVQQVLNNTMKEKFLSLFKEQSIESQFEKLKLKKEKLQRETEELITKLRVEDSQCRTNVLQNNTRLKMLSDLADDIYKFSNNL